LDAGWLKFKEILGQNQGNLNGALWKHCITVVMGGTRIFNSIPILLRSVSVDTDTYFDAKINTKFQFSIPEVST
jgi:hypothetical protein